MKRKHLILAVVPMVALVVTYLFGSHYLNVKSLSKLTGLSISLRSQVEVTEDGGMMGGTRDVWVQPSHFSDLMSQCSVDRTYTHGVIDYRKYRGLTAQFDEKGLGRSPGCIKEIVSKNGTILIAIDNGYIFISEQWQ